MAIDKTTGKRKRVVIKEQPKKKIPKYETDYEEELKRQLFAEESNKKEIKKEESKEGNLDFYEETREFHHVKRNGEWDVPLDEQILYFDPELSYEITGYRPISMSDGLDFNPEEFTKTASIYETKGKYTDFPEGTKPYNDF